MIWSGKTEQEGRNFRLYDLEVLELSNDVSFLVVLPPVESVCNSPFDGPGQSAFSRECTYVPVQAFEMRKYTYRYLHQTTITINNNNNNMESVAVKLVKASSQFWPVHYNELSYCWDGRAMLHKSNFGFPVGHLSFLMYFFSNIWEYRYKSLV